MDELDNLDFDSAERKVEQKQEQEQSQQAPVADNDCGDSCTI